MKIKGKLKGDIEGVKLLRNPETNTLVGTPKARLKVTGKEAADILGEELASLLFGEGSRLKGTEEGSLAFAYKQIKPASVLEIHDIKISGGKKISVQPVFKSVEPVKNEDAVYLVVEFPIVLDNQEEAGAIAWKTGETVSIQFNPSQQELPLKVVKQGKGPFGNPKPVVSGGAQAQA